MKTRIALVLMLLATSTYAHADDLAESMRACSAVENDETRLACFDGLLAPEPTAAPVAESTTPPPAPASLGAEVLRDKNQSAGAEEKLEFSATLTRCNKNANGRYYFYFSNGQVWRQVKAERTRFRDCDYEVTITKDYFGYRMKQDGEKRSVRIKRIK